MDINTVKQPYDATLRQPLYPPPGRLVKQKAALRHMHNANFIFRTIEEAENIAVLLANSFPEPDRVVNGLAELMFNAIEHGNLDIGYSLKAELCQLGLWREEIEARLDSPIYKCRTAEASLTRKDGGIYVIIADHGKGFDWKSHLKIDPMRAGIRSGRGIAMANSISFDKLTYNKEGNKVIAYVADSSSLIW